MKIVRVRNNRLNEEFTLTEPIEVPNEILKANEESRISYYVLKEINNRWAACRTNKRLEKRKRRLK